VGDHITKAENCQDQGKATDELLQGRCPGLSSISFPRIVTNLTSVDNNEVIAVISKRAQPPRINRYIPKAMINMMMMMIHDANYCFLLRCLQKEQISA
jgi:hypothetical protein